LTAPGTVGVLQRTNQLLSTIGGWTFLAGTVLLAALIPLVGTPMPRSAYILPFLGQFTIAVLAYWIACARIGHDRIPLVLIWFFAILFRSVLLLTTPTLSDDIYRYMWDGHLLTQGINPYSHPVDSPALAGYSTAIRTLVNHSWMASPYLPTAQGYFTLLTALFSQSVFAFQLGAVLLDLSTAWLVMDMLVRLKLPAAGVLIYLWHPLLIIEYAQNAHIDALMVFWVVFSFWLIVRGVTGSSHPGRLATGSVLSIVAATLTKGLPLLLVPLFIRRWGLKRLFAFGILIVVILAFFSLEAGWGLFGPLDGRGIFGAIRIYLSDWNFNGSLYYWLEVSMSGYPTPGAVPQQIAGPRNILFAKLITNSIFLLVISITGYWVWRNDRPGKRDAITRTRTLLRLALVPLCAYIIFTPTVHPWYLAVVIPFAPFLLSSGLGDVRARRFLWPLLYLSCTVVLSYITYVDPNEWREFNWVRSVEYVPFYALLLWAALPWLRALPRPRQISSP
jgi:hypothetical protein